MSDCPQCSHECDSTHRFCPACGFPIGEVARSEEDPLLGTTLPGGFVILEPIGVGGMGRVYRAEQTALGRTVAVKIIHPHLAGDESAAARFITEARTASRLNHPNSVSVIDFGKTDGGQLYLVMEFLRGRDLARVLYEDGPLPFRRIIEILKQVLAALSEAHHIGIIHRDLKPENVVIEPMRTGGDFVKVVDFGLAKMLTGAKGPAITSVGIVCGTPDYMAPEQGRGDTIDARADLYAMGVILFQLLTGQLPYEAESPTQVVLMHMTVPAPDPRAIAPDRDIPAALAMVTLSALAKNAGDRYQTAEAFSDALSAVQAQLEAPTQRASVAPPDPASIHCPECGSAQPRTQRFCGDCGARLATTGAGGVVSASPAQAAPSSKSRSGATVLGAMPLTARDSELTWLLERQRDGSAGLVAARVIGEPGMGKTRLLREFLEVAGEPDGTVVTGPDPFWSEVGYYALRNAVAELAGVEVDASDAQWPPAPAEVRRVLHGMFNRGERTSPVPIDPELRRRWVADTLRWALRTARERTGKPILLVVEDLHRVDGASRNAVVDVISDKCTVEGLVVATHSTGFDAHWPGRLPSTVLNGLAPDIASHMLNGAVPPDAFEAMAARGVPPMYVEQLVRFNQEGGTQPPPRLADIVALRIARLNAGERRVLPTLSVLGDRIQPRLIQGVVDVSIDVSASLAMLTQAGMVASHNGMVSIAHPLIREIAEVTIPAGARRDLHVAAMSLGAELNLPLEARALHAFSAQDSFEALLLLEQAGDLASSRADVAGAVLHLRRGLELARREISRGEIDDPMRAVLIFSRKLGEALTRDGDLTDADGVLREALDLAPPSGEDRAKVLFALARVARARQRAGDAMSYLQEAADLAHRSASHELVAAIRDAQREWAS